MARRRRNPADYKGHETWVDMSPFVTHFTRRVKPEDLPQPPPPKHSGGLTRVELRERLDHIAAQTDDGEMRIKKILYERRIRPGAAPQGLARDVRGLGDTQRVVCLSEVPPHLANRLAARRSHHGIGFRKDWLIEHGGVPTWTLDQLTAQSRLLKQWIKEAKQRGVDPNDPLWEITPHIDEPRHLGRGRRVDWQHEREWRVIGELSFEPEDVAYLFIPEAMHDAVRDFLATNETGPRFHCPIIDTGWDRDRVRKALSEID